MKRVWIDVEEKCEEAIKRVRDEMEASSALDLKEMERNLSTSHATELEELRTELQRSSLVAIECVRSEAEKHQKGENEEVDRIRKETEASSALAVEERTRRLSSLHAVELEELKVELQLKSSAEMDRVCGQADRLQRRRLIACARRWRPRRL